MASVSQFPYVTSGKRRIENTTKGVLNQHTMSNNAVFPQEGQLPDVEHYTTVHKPTHHPQNLQPTLRLKMNKYGAPQSDFNVASPPDQSDSNQLRRYSGVNASLASATPLQNSMQTDKYVSRVPIPRMMSMKELAANDMVPEFQRKQAQGRRHAPNSNGMTNLLKSGIQSSQVAQSKGQDSNSRGGLGSPDEQHLQPPMFILENGKPGNVSQQRRKIYPNSYGMSLGSDSYSRGYRGSFESIQEEQRQKNLYLKRAQEDNNVYGQQPNASQLQPRSLFEKQMKQNEAIRQNANMSAPLSSTQKSIYEPGSERKPPMAPSNQQLMQQQQYQQANQMPTLNGNDKHQDVLDRAIQYMDEQKRGEGVSGPYLSSQPNLHSYTNQPIGDQPDALKGNGSMANMNSGEMSRMQQPLGGNFNTINASGNDMQGQQPYQQQQFDVLKEEQLVSNNAAQGNRSQNQSQFATLPPKPSSMLPPLPDQQKNSKSRLQNPEPNVPILHPRQGRRYHHVPEDNYLFGFPSNRLASPGSQLAQQQVAFSQNSKSISVNMMNGAAGQMQRRANAVNPVTNSNVSSGLTDRLVL